MRRMSNKSQPWQAVFMSLRSWDVEEEYQEATLASLLHESMELVWTGWVSRANLGKLYAWVYGSGMRRMSIKGQSRQANDALVHGAAMRRMSIKSQHWQANNAWVYGAGMRKVSIKSQPWQALCMSIQSWDEEDEYQEPTLASFMHESTELGRGRWVSRANLGKIAAQVYETGMRRISTKEQPWQACCMTLRSRDPLAGMQSKVECPLLTFASLLHESTEPGSSGWDEEVEPCVQLLPEMLSRWNWNMEKWHEHSSHLLILSMWL